MNLWVSLEDEGARRSDENAFRRSLAPIAGIWRNWERPPLRTSHIRRRCALKSRRGRFWMQRCRVFSFIFGIPPREILEECRAKGIVTIGAATTLDEAVALRDAGVDAIAASGFEAAGHRGSFLRAAEDSRPEPCRWCRRYRLHCGCAGDCGGRESGRRAE